METIRFCFLFCIESVWDRFCRALPFFSLKKNTSS